MNDLIDCPSRIAGVGRGLCDDEDSSVKTFHAPVSVFRSVIRGNADFQLLSRE